MSLLTLKTIHEILGEKFVVPYYQRGYRWTKGQVEQLLEDIWEFSERKKNKNEFYCLQPIVVKKTEGGWELIDGQQRLTTIYLVLKFIEFKLLKGGTFRTDYGKDIFSINYEVREDSGGFLTGVTNKIHSNDNIDFYYISQAYENISNFFDYPNKFDRSKLDDFLKILLNHIKVIWYEVEETADSVEIFTRLNIGKIPLTNAELIKALFLNSSNFSNSDKEQIRLKQLQIATEWDEIEQTLQNDEFWYFIFDENSKIFFNRNYDTRIEYIFDLIKKRPKDAEDYFTFFEFYKDFKKKDIETLWKDIKKFFYTFKEWYEDSEFYHLIGYLIAVGKDIGHIKDEYEKKTKSEFRKYLKNEILQNIKDGIPKTIDNGNQKILEEIKQLEYGDKIVGRVLLLFNILILLNNKGANIRFPFDRYKKEKWDIEHVFSRTDIELKGKALKEYIKLIIEFWTGKKIEAEKLDEATIDKLKDNIDEDVKELFGEIVNIYNADNKNIEQSFDKLKIKLVKAFQEENIKNRDNISNLVLLDAKTNRAYKNAFFPIKRNIILEKIKNGSFVPIGTQNVFLKAYSKRFDNILFWTEGDAADYLNAIIETFELFFNQ